MYTKRFVQKVHRWIWAFCSNIDLCGGHLHFLRGMNMQFSVITMRMHFFTFKLNHLRLFECLKTSFYVVRKRNNSTKSDYRN